MTVNKTYGYIKNRILSLLCENIVGECLTDDINREQIIALLPDTLNVCISRMYESLPLGKALAVCNVRKSEFCGLAKLTLPQDFFRPVSVNGENVTTFKIVDNELYLPDIYHTSVCLVYKKTPPQIDGNTVDEHELDMTDLAVEALCVLAAAELCRPEENALYTRLIYKYSDLSEGIYNAESERGARQNSFFKSEKKRWK